MSSHGMTKDLKYQKWTNERISMKLDQEIKIQCHHTLHFKYALTWLFTGHREIMIDHRRQFFGNIIIHIVMLGPFLFGGVDVKACTNTKVPAVCLSTDIGATCIWWMWPNASPQRTEIKFREKGKMGIDQDSRGLVSGQIKATPCWAAGLIAHCWMIEWLNDQLTQWSNAKVHYRFGDKVIFIASQAR